MYKRSRWSHCDVTHRFLDYSDDESFNSSSAFWPQQIVFLGTRSDQFWMRGSKLGRKQITLTQYTWMKGVKVQRWKQRKHPKTSLNVDSAMDVQCYTYIPIDRFHVYCRNKSSKKKGHFLISLHVILLFFSSFFFFATSGVAPPEWKFKALPHWLLVSGSIHFF